MQLQKLQYQLDAIDSVVNAVPVKPSGQVIDVKMETGTGKTYVYTRLMHELKRQFGFFKFIILVPTVAIKEGVKMSIQNEDWQRHFRQEFGNQTIQLGVISAGDFSVKSGKRKQMPEALRTFCGATEAETQSVNCLLLNAGMLASKSMTNDYDSTLLGSISCPMAGLKEAKPVLLIDEPHRFKQTAQAWNKITGGLQPPLIIRFGATFPQNDCKPVYELNSVRAFNEGYVKGVHIVYPALSSKETKYKVEINKQAKSVSFKTGKRSVDVNINDDLSVVDSAFAGITLHSIASKSSATLSNDLEIYSGMELLPETFGSSYQELMLNEALNVHFAKERENFRRLDRVKTISLFFIDGIASFRGENNWLRKKFEELLRNKLKEELEKAKGDYRNFLQASLQNIDGTIAGYFSQDNSVSEANIQNEVDDILRNKEQMLQFKDKQGKWNLRRFLFSKWTLREGWDNPNVFVITKLRTSGSETSKIQEVGRGLRLPFDEHGRRLSKEVCNDDFYLTYIVDYSERDFARKLIKDINESGGGNVVNGKISDTIINKLVEKEFAKTAALVKAKLLIDEIINEHNDILDWDKLAAMLPQDSGITVRKGKIIEGNTERPKVHLNKTNFAKLKKLWDTVTKRYCLHFAKVAEADLNSALREIFSDDVFVKPSVEIVEEHVVGGGNSPRLDIAKQGYRSAASALGILSYGEFLKRICKESCLPVPLIHQTICEVRKGMDTAKEVFNTMTVQNILGKFEKKFEKLFEQKFSYSPLDYRATTSIYKDNGDFVDDISPGNVGGTKADTSIVNMAKYLFNEVYYDSPIEHEILKVSPPEDVIVYGKLPKRSIALPTYTGGTTSPDFVYAVKNKKNIEIHLVVETKSDNPRLSDNIAVTVQQKAFETFGENIHWRLETDVKKFEMDLKALQYDSGS